ncbi:MAG: hypothetical protein O3A88_05755, partial [Proteobacteria bacterium]|nr:hypothetical protein [Pseudomonadota bacterium]
VDRLWPADARAALAERVRVQDPAFRSHLMREIVGKLTRKGQVVTVADAEAALAHELAEIGRPAETARRPTGAT